MNEREKIIGIIQSVKYCETNNRCDECKYDKELNDYKDMSCGSLKAADALIAANIGDVTEYKKTIRDLNTDVVAYRALSKADALEQIIEGQKSLMDEYKRRAEVAERALSWLCDETMRDIRIIMYPSIGKQVRDKQELYDYCIEQAEREIEEEKGE